MKPYKHSTHHHVPPSHDHHHSSGHHWHTLPLLLSITLTLLFFISISYLIFNSIKQCLIRHQRCRRNTTNHESRDPVCMAQLGAIPVLIYDHSAGETETCAVCLMECVRGEEVRVLPGCKHLFHKACVDEWLVGRSSFCPVCRGRVIERAVEPGSARALDVNGEMEGAGAAMNNAIVGQYRSFL
ncbi:Antimicrobial/protein inhibitor gamma-crystallin-like protein [Dioscorea alata]|uniref:Antimicrobial/protein inhibitor gamma-crystallin-like protein n=1 Tax=Dioscorea alata TaxID=55571 RepID=A0ACB7V622_DIOAL|nr:Antimicrobial/protein inhibitor gamma-crystallin-like protein [Dioscorea alata]